MSEQTEAQHAIEGGTLNPYDAPDSWREDDDESPPPAAVDWAHAAARGVLHDLLDRRGIKNGFDNVDEYVRFEIVQRLGDIIREADASREPGP